MKTSFLTTCFPFLETELVEEIESHARMQSFAKGDHIVKQGEFIRFLPIVVKGSIKVCSMEDSIPFLLYYISSGESCIYSFAHTFNNDKAEFSASAEIDSDLLLLPLPKVNEWLKIYPSLGSLVLADYQKQYKDLLNTTKQITCYQLDERLLEYLKTKAQIMNSNLLNIKHQEIADDLGTSREVISRVLKKLSKSNHIKQVGHKIKMI